MTETRGRCSCRGGFTLIELLAAAALIAASVIASAALMLRNQSKTKVIQTAQQLTLAARAARVQAVESGQSCGLSSIRKNRCFYIRTSSSDEPQSVLSGPYSKPIPLPESVQLEHVLLLDSEQADLFEIEFKPTALPKLLLSSSLTAVKTKLLLPFIRLPERVK
jgi:type II secretory pathway pseudopilin PulG